MRRGFRDSRVRDRHDRHDSREGSFRQGESRDRERTGGPDGAGQRRVRDGAEQAVIRAADGKQKTRGHAAADRTEQERSWPRKPLR